MPLHRKIVGAIGIGFIGLFEIAERADFIKQHLPRWVTMHSDLTVIALLIGICLYLIFTHEESDKRNSTIPISNAPTGGTATASAEGGKVVQHFHYPGAISAPPPNEAKLKHNVQYIGVEITPVIPIVLMYFRNVEIPGRPIGHFKSARLKVNYYLESSGEEVAEIFPAKWSGFDQDRIEISVKRESAVIAMHSSIGWEALSTKTVQADIGWEYIIERTFLPSDLAPAKRIP